LRRRRLQRSDAVVVVVVVVVVAVADVEVVVLLADHFRFGGDLPLLVLARRLGVDVIGMRSLKVALDLQRSIHVRLALIWRHGIPHATQQP